MNEDSDKMFVTVGQLATEVGLSSKLIRRLVSEGCIPHLRSGKKIWINRTKALEFLENPVNQVDQFPPSKVRRIEV